MEGTPPRARVRNGLAALIVVVTGAACGGDAQSPTPGASGTASPSASGGTAITDLSVIGCASDDPDGVGALTGVWEGRRGDLYSVRQVGECVWWFGTEVSDIEPGATEQGGFANVASGRLVGTQLDVEWVDIPLGDIFNGGGLTFYYDEPHGQLLLTEQRGGGIAFGDTVLTCYRPPPSPDASPSASASP